MTRNGVKTAMWGLQKLRPSPGGCAGRTTRLDLRRVFGFGEDLLVSRSRIPRVVLKGGNNRLGVRGVGQQADVVDHPGGGVAGTQWKAKSQGVLVEVLPAERAYPPSMT